MKSFQDLNLNPSIMRAMGEMGFEAPTPIQAQSLPILLDEPTDFLGLAATGTGKTVAFGVPLLERVNPAVRAVQALVLCPTRELAIQVAGQLNLIARYLGTKALPIYGGSSFGDQIRGLRQGATIVVGTPGRVVDHMTRGTLDLAQLETVVLDEADEMISMGFKDDLEAILSRAPRETSRIWLFCATMGEDVRQVANDYLRNPAQVKVNQAARVPSAIEQIFYRVHESDKPEIVCKLIDAAPDFYGIIFCQTKALVADLTGYLQQRSYAVDCLHGDMTQDARDRTMRSFRERRVKLLVCTDVASRGIDVKDITHVINYSLPREMDSYVHRIGRTARSGKTGFALNLVTPSHRGLIARIEHVTKSKMREGKLPTRKEIGTKKVSAVLEKFQSQDGFKRALELMSDSWKESLAGMSGDEIAARFLTLSFPEVFAERAQEVQPQRPAEPQPRVVLDGHRPHRRPQAPGQASFARGALPNHRPRIAIRSEAAAPKGPWKPYGKRKDPARSFERF